MLATNLRGRRPNEFHQDVAGAALNRGGNRADRKSKIARNPLVLPRLLAVTLIAMGVAGVHTWQTQAGATIAKGVTKERKDSASLAYTVRAAKELQAQDSLFTARVTALQSIDERRFLWPHVMEAIQAAVPSGVWLNALEEKRSGKEPLIRIKGSAITSNDITAFIDALQQSPWFVRPHLMSTDQEATRHGAITEFQIELQYAEATGADDRQFIELRPDGQRTGAKAPTTGPLNGRAGAVVDKPTPAPPPPAKPVSATRTQP